MRVDKIRGANPQPADPARRPTEPISAEPTATGRALIAVTPVTAAHEPPSHEWPAHYRQAPFLAHLIATKDQHPQTRERRRAEPYEALASYRATTALLGLR